MPPSSPDQKSLVGYTIGKCKLLRVCGRGAMGTVYKGTHSGLDIDVAVKILPPHLGANANLVERFLREARLAARLNHANTVRVYDVGEESGYYYLVMEFVEGTDALELVRKLGPQDATVVADIGAGAARALASAHQNNVIHRDIKPANLMLPGNGGVKVADFGLARALASESGLTMTGAIMGTPDYMAPEQAQGVAVGPKADVYSLGATLYHMFVGRPPFAGATPMAVAVQHVTNRIVVPEERVTDEPSRRLTRIIHEMTLKDHDKRPGDLDEIAARLEEVARLNKRTRKLMFEGATIFATTGHKIDADAINKEKERAAEAAIDRRASSPHLDALRRAAEKARTSGVQPAPASSGGTSRPGSHPGLGGTDSVRGRKPDGAPTPSRGTDSSVQRNPTVSRESDSSVRRTSNPAMTPSAAKRPATASQAGRARLNDQPQDSEWEGYAAKAFPTFNKENILDGSAGNRAAKATDQVAPGEAGSGVNDSWDGRSGGENARPDYSRPQVFDERVVLASRSRGGGPGLVVALLVIGVCVVAGWYFFMREQGAAIPTHGDAPLVHDFQLDVMQWQAGGLVTSVVPALGFDGVYTVTNASTISRWPMSGTEPAATFTVEGSQVVALVDRDDGTLAVALSSGRIMMLNGQNLSVISPSAVTRPGATCLLYFRSVLLVGDMRGVLQRADSQDGGLKVAEGQEPVTALAATGDEVWAAAGRTMRVFQMVNGALVETRKYSGFESPIVSFAICTGARFAVMAGKVQRIGSSGPDGAAFALVQPAATASGDYGFLVGMGAQGVTFLSPTDMIVRAALALPESADVTSIAAVPRKTAVVVGTRDGRLLMFTRR